MSRVSWIREASENAFRSDWQFVMNTTSRCHSSWENNPLHQSPRSLYILHLPCYNSFLHQRTLTMVATCTPQPVLTREWKFDPTMTFVTYRTHWTKAETLAKQRLALLQKATQMDAFTFLHLLDDLIAFAKLN